VLSLNMEYLDFITDYRGLSELINDNRFYVPPVSFGEVIGQLPRRSDLPDEPELERPKKLLDFIRRDCRQLFEEGDPNAITKLRMGLYLLRQREQQQPSTAEAPEGDLLFFYRFQMEGLAGALNYYAESLFGRLSRDDQFVCARLIGALAVYDPGKTGIATRRPVFGKQLVALSVRGEKSSPVNGAPGSFQVEQAYANQLPTIQAEDYQTVNRVLETLNSGPFRLVQRVNAGMPANGGSFNDYSIVDLEDEILINNWGRIGEWLFLETRNAGIYLKLVKDALVYFKGQYSPEPAALPAPSSSAAQPGSSQGLLKTAETRSKQAINNVLCKNYARLEKQWQVVEQAPKTALYEGGQLVSALDFWQSTCPNEAWARQYYDLDFDLPEADKFPDEHERTRRVADHYQSTLHAAQAFLYESQQEHLKINKLKEDLQEERIKCFKRRNLLFSIVALIALGFMVWAIILKQKAERLQENLELHGFIDILAKTQVIFEDPRDNEKKDTVWIPQIKDRIKNDKAIRSNEAVLNVLEQHKFLDIEPAFSGTRLPPNYRRISERAILELDALFRILKSEQAIRNALPGQFEKMLAMPAEEAIEIEAYSSAEQPDAFLQFPYLYQSLKEHLESSYLRKAVYLGASGKGTQQIQDDPGHYRHSSIVSDFSSNPSEAEEFAFSDLNGNIWISSKLGEQTQLVSPGKPVTCIRYSRDGASLFAGTADGGVYRYDEFRNPQGKGPNIQPKLIYQAASAILYIETVDDTRQLVVVESRNLLLLGKGAGGYYPLDSEPLTNSLPIIRAATSANDAATYVIGGKDGTLIYNLMAQNFGPPRTVEHKGVTITAIGIQEGGSPKIALGSESGKVWIERFDELKSSRRLLDERGVDYHRSAVTGLRFNPVYPQMASASLDGSIRLWNLRMDKNEGFDNVRLENTRQGVWSICYINKDELVATENVNLRVWKTNAYALMIALSEASGKPIPE